MDPSPPTSISPARRTVRGRRLRRIGLVGAVAALAMLSATGGADAWTTDARFSISGHGWGHGIGMSQWGAYGYAKHGWSYREILKHYYTGIEFKQRDNVDIRVRLRSGLNSVKVSCPNAYTASGTSASLRIPAGVVATTTYVGSAYRVSAGGATKDFDAPVSFTPSKGSLRVLTATDLGDTGAYRGVIRVVRSGGKLMMIDKVPLEAYLRGVVPHEVSPSWPAEALKAQACAARAYALNSRNPGSSWDVYCDVRDQAYRGVGIEDSRTDAAVKATAGVAPTYNGKVISAYYSSSSGGRTENIEFGWPGAAPQPYLKGVADPYDSYASRHDWGPVRRTAAQIRAKIGGKGTLRAVYRVKRGTSPRIVKAAIVGTGGVTFIDGNELRVKLGLNSTWATFTSMSISPAARDHAVVQSGGSVVLKGRIYPALASGDTVRLRYYYAGAWHSRSVATARATQNLGSGYTAAYSSYSLSVQPLQTTKYYFLHDKARSPTTTVSVR